jgi:hypothetical protein
VLSPSLVVVHDAGGGGEDDVAELTGRQQTHNPLLEISQAHVEARVDDTALVQAAGELDDDLAATVVIDLFELADIALALHELEEPDDNLRRRAQDDLTLALLVGVVDALQSVAQNTGANHDDGWLYKDVWSVSDLYRGWVVCVIIGRFFRDTVDV